MLADIQRFYNEAAKLRWTEVDGLTDFMDLYDGYLAGVAYWYLQGDIDNAPEIPGPDVRWCRALIELPKKSSLTEGEQEFYRYFYAAEKLRIALKKTRDDHYRRTTMLGSMSLAEADVLLDAIADYHGLWRSAWDLHNLFTEYGKLEAQPIAEHPVRQLLAKGWIVLYRTTLVSVSQRSSPELLTSSEVETALVDPQNWELPQYGSIEILYAATEEGKSIVSIPMLSS